MKEEKVFLVINTIPNPENMEGYQLYLSKIVPIFMSNGGSLLGSYKTIEQVMGNSGIKTSAVFEFPSAKAIKDMISGSEFNSLNQLRKEAYNQVDLMICDTR